jgi:iron complex outermembrane receptor protein
LVALRAKTVTGKKQDGDYLPLIPANNWNNTIRTEFSIKNWLIKVLQR